MSKSFLPKWAGMVFCLIPVAVVPAAADVYVAAPSNGVTVSSPVHFVASGTSDAVVTAVQVYIDNVLVYTADGASLDTSLALADGTHYAVIKAWDSTGASWVSAMNINVATGASGGGSAAPATADGVSISWPSDGAASGSPVHVTASGSAPGGAVGMQIYADGTLVYGNLLSTVDTFVSLSPGWHNLAVKVWGNNSWNTYSSVNVNVQDVAASTPPATQGASPTGATGVYSIQQQPDWSSCNTCAGGADVPYSMTEGISNPSLSGAAAQFWLGGSTPYASALWWKELAPVSATNFKYDADFYLDNPGAAQGLEFDVNQVIGGYRYIFGTECDIRNTGTFRVWDTLNGFWVSTGIPCPTPAANVWNHITWEFQRTASGQALFVAVTLNGVRTPLNMSFWPKPNSGSELNAAFQMDGNYRQENYSTWVDNVTLAYW